MYARTNTHRHRQRERDLIIRKRIFFAGESSPFRQRTPGKIPQHPKHRVRNHEGEAYLEVREEPFITIVVVVFGVVLIHSSSVGLDGGGN